MLGGDDEHTARDAVFVCNKQLKKQKTKCVTQFEMITFQILCERLRPFRHHSTAYRSSSVSPLASFYFSGMVSHGNGTATRGTVDILVPAQTEAPNLLKYHFKKSKPQL